MEVFSSGHVTLDDGPRDATDVPHLFIDGATVGSLVGTMLPTDRTGVVAVEVQQFPAAIAPAYGARRFVD